MEPYWIFLGLAIAIALCAGKIDKAAQGNGKLKKWLALLCVGLAVSTMFLLATALSS